MSGGRLSRRKHPGCGIFDGDLELGAAIVTAQAIDVQGALDRVTMGDDTGMASSTKKIAALLIQRALCDDGDDRQLYS